MKSLILLSILGFTFLILSGCKASKTVTQSASAGPNLSGGCAIGKWPDSRLPLNLKMSSEFTSDYSNADLVAGLNPLEQMAKAWNDPVAPGKTLITVPFSATSSTGFNSTSSFRDTEIGLYKSHTWFTNVSSSALAITQFYGVVTSSPGLGEYIELTHADIIVNYRDYGSRFTMTNNPTIEFDVPTIVLHEMGHLLGLCHESTASSVMAPYYLTDQRALKAFDTDIIQDIYVADSLSRLSALTNSQATNIVSPVGTTVSGIIELKEDGECTHKINGKVVYRHKGHKGAITPLVSQ